MKKLQLYFVTLASLTLVSFLSLQRLYSTSLLQRFDSGSLEQEIMRIHSGRNGESSEIEKNRAKRNMYALRRLVNCIKKNSSCRAAPRR